VPNGAEVPARGKGSYRLALDWNSYLHHGIWVSRRGEDTDEKGPTTPAGAGLAYYRVDAGNCYSLPFALPKLDEFPGQVLHHSGKGLAGATVYLVSGQSLQLVNGQPGGGHWSNGRLESFGGFGGAKALTDKDGRFTLTGVAGDHLVVVAGDLVWLARLQTGKEQTIQLPQPGKVTISYDISGAAKDGVIRLQLMTWDMPEWAGVASTERYVVCKNGGTLEVDGLAPGEYDVFRYVECGRIGMMGFTSFLDRCKLKIEAGKAARLDYVRTKGGPISGEIVGLKNAGIEGAVIKVRSEQATGGMNTSAEGEWKILNFDAVVSDADGRFTTSRIAPGTYLVTAEGYKPESPTERRSTGIRLPQLLGKVKVVVPESGEVKPIRIEAPPPPDAKTR
jgi:hypothetical protein